MTINERIEAGRRERRVLTRVSRAAWRLEQAERERTSALVSARAEGNGVRGKGRTSRIVFLGRDARHAIAGYLETERPGHTDEQSEALFLAASSIGAPPRMSRNSGGLNKDGGHERRR